MNLQQTTDYYRCSAAGCDQEIALLQSLGLPTDVLEREIALIEKQRALWLQLAAELAAHIASTDDIPLTLEGAQ